MSVDVKIKMHIFSNIMTGFNAKDFSYWPNWTQIFTCPAKICLAGPVTILPTVPSIPHAGPGPLLSPANNTNTNNNEYN